MRTTKERRAPQRSRQALLAPLILSGAVLGLLLSAIGALSFLQLERVGSEHAQHLSGALAQSKAANIAQFIGDHQAGLRVLSTRDAVTSAIRDKAPLKLRALESQYQSTLEFADQISFVPLGPLGTAATDFPRTRLNGVEIAMAVAASRGEPVLPEVYRRGRETVISLLEPVSGDAGAPAGIAILRIDSETVRQMLENTAAGQGKLILSQQIGGQNVDVASVGQASSQAAAAPVDVPGTNGWQLRLIPSASLLTTWLPSPALAWAALSLSLLCLLGCGLAVYFRAGKRLDGQIDALKCHLEHLLLKSAAPAPALQLPALTRIAELAQQLSEKNPPAKKRPAAVAVSGAQAPAAAPAPSAAPEAQTPAPEPEGEETANGDPFEIAIPAPAEAVAPLEFPVAAAEADSEEAGMTVSAAPPAEIFRAYDIRGVVDEELTADAVYMLGRAIGSEARDRSQTTVSIARDGRLSSEALSIQLARGLQESGVDVVDLGLTPTPTLYFATHQTDSRSGVMVTGSHNPPAYNGLKIVIDGDTLHGDDIQKLHQRIVEGPLLSGEGSYSKTDISQPYIDAIAGDVITAQPIKLVIDCGNGATGELAPALFERLGCEVTALFSDIDGSFPNHHPDPAVPENLSALIDAVRETGADLGIAFDGDGDRLGVVSGSGQIIPADYLLMLLAEDVLSRNPGCDVIYDVKCSRHLGDAIASAGGHPVMWKSGHSLVKQKMQETGALLGGEFTGHIFFKERWFGFDDALYSAARLLEILSADNPDLDLLLERFPKFPNTPEILLEVGELRKFDIVEQLADKADFGLATVTDVDGLRIEYVDGWALVRASNTSPRLSLRFEAEDIAALARIRQQVTEQLQRIEPRLQIPA